MEIKLFKGYILEEAGGVDKLKIADIELPELGDHDLLIKHSAIGINYDDIQIRKGIYNIGTCPLVLGSEGVGYIEQKGHKVDKRLSIGDRVAYFMPLKGAYCTHRVIHQNYILKVDTKFSDKLIAAVLKKGTVAHYLTRKTFNIKAKNKIVVYGPTGGVGSIIVQLAKYFQAEVIGIVSIPAKIEYAKYFGCDHVFLLNSADLVAQVMSVTQNQGVDVVYNLVGGDSLKQSIEFLSEFGLLVNYGDCAGEVLNFDINLLSKKSTFLTRPRISDYQANRYEMIMSSTDILAAVEKKIVKIQYTEYTFQDIPKIHRIMESRKSIGSNIVTF